MSKDPNPVNQPGHRLRDLVSEQDRSGFCSTGAEPASAAVTPGVKNTMSVAPGATPTASVPAASAASATDEVACAVSEPELTHVDVGRMVFSFYCIAPDRECAEARLVALHQRLLQLVEQSSNVPQPERSNFAEPRVRWLEWCLQAPQTRLSWCGVCELVLQAEQLDQGQGCFWQLEQYKRFARWLDRLLGQALTETARDFPTVQLDDKPFLWTLALDITPRVVWTDQELQRYRRSLTRLVRVRSEDAHLYTDRAMQEMLRSNLAYTTEELQLLHHNTGLIYVDHDRFRNHGGFDYVHSAIVDNNAILRALRACLLVFRRELDSRLHNWLQERLRGRRLRRVLRETLSYADLASQLLRQLDEQAFCATRKIGHQQTVFGALLQRYHIPELVASLQQQVAELHHRIADLQNQFQASQLRLINVLVVVPAMYSVWRFLQEFWPLLQSFWTALVGK